MPEISRFYGIIIKMFFDDHNPPHFHALYGDYEVLIGITHSLSLQDICLQERLALSLNGLTLHQNKLLDDWRRAQDHEPLNKIDPLP